MEQEEEPDGEARVSAAKAGGHICVKTPARAGARETFFAYADKTGDALKAALVFPPARSDELNQNPLGARPLPPVVVNDRDEIAFEDGTRRARSRVPKTG